MLCIRPRFDRDVWGKLVNGIFCATLQQRRSSTVHSVDMFAVIGRGLFYEVAPSRFGTLGKAFFTLFQLITLDDWFYMYSDVVAKSPGGSPALVCVSLFSCRLNFEVSGTLNFVLFFFWELTSQSH